MPFTRLAINRPIGTLMVVLIVVFLGLVALVNIPADLLPDIAFPAVAVITDYPGAGPYEVESLVSRPLEESLAGVGEVRHITSDSLEGTSIILAEFGWGTDIDFAALEVREAIDHVRDLLPDEASAPVVIKTDPAMLPVMRVSVSGPYDLVEISRMAEQIEGRLERIEGVAAVDIEGEVREEILVEVDPVRLNAHGLSHMQVSAALQEENVDLPAGHFTEAGERLTLRTVGEFVSLEDVRSVTIESPRGATVALDDVASVELRESETETRTRLDGRPAVTLSIREQSGADTVAVASEIHRVLNELTGELPEDADLVVVRDQSDFINRSIATVSSNVLYGGLLAVLILYLFLTDARTVLVIGLGIPISVIATFAFMFFSGITLNLVSLGGLALGVGMLVDNAIVILENIFRHREEGASRADAALQGTGEVAGAVTASTLTTVAVFLPVLLIEGLAAEIFRELAMTISFALASSLFVSLTFIPMIAALFLGRPRRAGGSIADRSARVQARMGRRYDRIVRRALRRRFLVLAVAAVAFALAIWGGMGMPSVFLPEMDQGEIDVEIRMPRGTALDRTDQVVAEVEEILAGRGDVRHSYASVGQQMGEGVLDGEASDMGGLLIRLIDEGEGRAETAEVVSELRERLTRIPGAEIRVSLASGIAGEEQAMGAPVAVSVLGDDLDVLREHSGEILGIVEDIPGIVDARSSHEEGAPEIRLVVDRRRSGEYGMTAGQVAMMVRAAVEGEVATRYGTEGQDIDVRVAYPERYAGDLSSIEDIELLTPTGSIVSLSQLGSLQTEPGPIRISRRDQVRQVEISADLEGRSLGAVMDDVRADVDQLRLPPGYDVHYGGETEEMYEAFETLGYAFVAGCVLVYMVLAAQFESFRHPVIVMATIPLALIGVVGGLTAWGLPLSVPAIVGVIGMAGIVVNNSIVMITYIDQLRGRGYERDEAVARAAGVRLRPILMTSCTTVLGLLPMALEGGAGSELQNAMAVSVLGGLVISTALTLLVIPCAYSTLIPTKEESPDE